MKRQRNTSNAPAPESPRLVWRYPARTRQPGDLHALPDSADGIGALYTRDGKPGEGIDTSAVPTPEEVQALGLRAWFYCATCDSYRPTPERYGSPSYCGGTGYGNDSDTGRAVCYRCCGERDRASMKRDGIATLYLVRKSNEPERTLGTFERAPALRASNWRVSNWPGTLELPVHAMKRGEHNWRNVSRVDVWFVFEGFVWHGVNLGDSQILRAKRTRTEWRDLGHGRGYGPHTPRKSRAKRAPAEAHN